MFPNSSVVLHRQGCANDPKRSGAWGVPCCASLVGAVVTLCSKAAGLAGLSDWLIEATSACRLPERPRVQGKLKFILQDSEGLTCHFRVSDASLQRHLRVAHVIPVGSRKKPQLNEYEASGYCPWWGWTPPRTGMVEYGFRGATCHCCCRNQRRFNPTSTYCG